MGEMLTIWAKNRTDLLQIIQAHHSSEYSTGNKQIAASTFVQKEGCFSCTSMEFMKHA